LTPETTTAPQPADTTGQAPDGAHPPPRHPTASTPTRTRTHAKDRRRRPRRTPGPLEHGSAPGREQCREQAGSNLLYIIKNGPAQGRAARTR
jgi:hypothetical protein